MIYYMDVKTLVEEFTNDHSPEEILDCDFIILSTRILTKQEKNVYRLRIFNERLLFSLENDDQYNLEKIKKELVNLSNYNDLIQFMTSIINAMIDNKTSIILCSSNEFRTKFISYVAQVLEDLFSYPIIDYKKDKNKDFYYDPVVVAKKIKKMEDYIKDLAIDTMPTFKNKYIKKMSKKELIKECKKLDFYNKDMTKEDMREVLELYL